MKNILMIHYELHFYRIPIYNKLAKELKKYNINLIIWPEKILNNQNIIEFDYLSESMTFEQYKNILKKYNIHTIINFLQPRSPSFLFYIKIIFFSYFKKLNLIYYGHGLNLESNSKTLDLIYNFLHFFYKKIILYTPNEKKNLWKIHHKKIEIAYNTLDLEDKDYLIKDTKEELRKKYNFQNEFIILFSGRIEKRKKLEILIKIMKKDHANIKLLVIGPIKNGNYFDEMKENKNIIYLGPIYDSKKMAEIFSIADVFSIPGHIGLGLVEALYWGLPILTLNLKHAPEIYYLKNDYNGFIVDKENELEKKLVELSINNKLLKTLSENAKNTYKEKANITNMINGFVTPIKELEQIKGKDINA
jgi:glycosyltransferase involved in cell wall biosynthesis